VFPSWPFIVVVVSVCGAVIPGPCGYAPDPAFDCSAGDPCARNLACVLVDPSDPGSRGFCRSADVACEDGQQLCAVPGLDRSGLCVPEEQFSTSSTHCGECFARCRGGSACVDGACVDEPAEDACVIERGNFDCGAGEGCVDGVCVDDAAGPGGILAPCDDGDDCDGGLCTQGVCTRPCDFGCAPGTECDDAAIPGGLCVPAPETGCFE
jgi:hypothetical protein